jgi:flagella basal body P-ring formation protein FlgA
VVRITVPCKRVVAAEPIKPDEPITASQLQEESYEGFPSETCESKIENVVGKVATRNISINSPVLRTMLATPASVLKGEQAIAEYRSGGVMLSLPVIVQRNGRIGEIIQVLNPTSHKTLLAQVIGEGRVTIEGASRTSNTEK